MTNALIQCRKLHKSYGKHDVLNSVDFEVAAGRLVGFLGPNGAGKTTTIRILLGLLKPTSGESTIFGKSCTSQGKSIREEIGYLPGDVHLYANLTGRRMLKFLSSARRKNCDAEMNRLAEVLDLELDKRVRNYSTGMKQKLGLIQAFMHRPQLLILDEPTSALDPLVRKSVFQELRNVVSEGRTVLFSSHSLSEVEELCDEVIIIRQGEIVEQQLVEKLRDNSLRRITIGLSERAAIQGELPKSFDVVSRTENTIVGTWSGPIDALTSWLSQQALSDLMIEPPDLNDLFLAFYERKEIR